MGLVLRPLQKMPVSLMVWVGLISWFVAEDVRSDQAGTFEVDSTLLRWLISARPLNDRATSKWREISWQSTTWRWFYMPPGNSERFLFEAIVFASTWHQNSMSRDATLTRPVRSFAMLPTGHWAIRMGSLGVGSTVAASRMAWAMAWPRIVQFEAFRGLFAPQKVKSGGLWERPDGGNVWGLWHPLILGLPGTVGVRAVDLW